MHHDRRDCRKARWSLKPDGPAHCGDQRRRLSTPGAQERQGAGVYGSGGQALHKILALQNEHKIATYKIFSRMPTIADASAIGWRD
jgi:hypothetical protein